MVGQEVGCRWVGVDVLMSFGVYDPRDRIKELERM